MAAPLLLNQPAGSALAIATLPDVLLPSTRDDFRQST